MLMQPSRTSKLKNVHTDSDLNIFKVSEFIMDNFFLYPASNLRKWLTVFLQRKEIREISFSL